MRTLAIGSVFAVLAVAAGMAIPAAYADHATATVSNFPGAADQKCADDDTCFVPSRVSVDLGGEVTWTNDDTAAHTVTSGSVAGGGPDGKFDSGLYLPGASFSVVFDEENYEPGTYDYYCIVHPWMVGTVTVVAAGEDGGDHMGDEMMDGESMDGMKDGEMMDGESMDGMKDGEMMDGESMDGDMMMRDDHGDDEHMEMDHTMMTDDEMMAMGDPSGTGMISDGTRVNVWTGEPVAGERLEVSMQFVGAEHVNHDIVVTQNGEVVLEDVSAHHHMGGGTHMTAPLPSSDPVDIEIVFNGYGISEPYTGPAGESVVFTNVVPEFGTVAAVILAVAIVSVIAVTARSGLSIVPRI